MEDDNIEVYDTLTQEEGSISANLDEGKERSIGTKLMSSHFMTRTGDKMWEFIIPLVLISISPQSLLPSALFGLVTTTARVLLASGIGRQIDQRNRLSVVTLGTLIQAISVFISSIVLYFLLEFKEESGIVNDIFFRWETSVLMVVLLISATVGSLAAMAMDISVERDWVPSSIQQEKYLLIVNTRMRQIDLVTEVGGPFLAGLLLVVPGVSETIGFVIIATYNFITFFPQYLLLRSVYQLVPSLSIKKSKSINKSNNTTRSKFGEWIRGDWNFIYQLINGWSLFVKQPICLIVISYSFLWATVLSPHGVVFTAYLNSVGYQPWILALFRGIGALLGFSSTFVFPYIVSKVGLTNASTLYIFEEGLFVFLSAVFFTMGYYNINVQFTGFLFMVTILLSRCGLYGFEIGEIQFVQQGIPENIRGQVNSVESSLTSLATVLVFTGGIVVNNPQYFIYLVWASAFFVNCGVVTFFIWRYYWSFHDMEHSHRDDDLHNDHLDYHLPEQAKTMENNKVHSHPHFHHKKSSAHKHDVEFDLLLHK